LRVLPARRTGRRVARVAYREVADQGVERRLVEDLRHEPHVLVDEDLRTVARRDARGLLAAVLPGVEAEVAELGHLFARRPHAEHAAGILWALLPREEFVTEPTIATGQPCAPYPSPCTVPSMSSSPSSSGASPSAGISAGSTCTSSL